MFFVPGKEYSLYRNATKGIVRWGSSDESWLISGDSPEVQAVENSDFNDHRGIDTAIEELAAFHEAKEIMDIPAAGR